MNILLSVILISSLIYSIKSGDFQVYNRPDYLTLIPNKNDENSKPITISNFADNLATLLGLSSDQTEAEQPAVLYSTRPFEIPSPVWLFHIEGPDRVSKNGYALEDNVEFDINSIQSKLSQTGNGDDLATASILISSESEIANFGEALQKQISQLNKQSSIKYIVITCDACNDDKSIEQIQTQLKTAIDQIISADPKALVIAFTTKLSARVRRARLVEEATENSNITIATMYSDEYPTMFNLFFWTSLILAIIIISIVYVFLTLDPGSDTIIYRMTAPRLKVD